MHARRCVLVLTVSAVVPPQGKRRPIGLPTELAVYVQRVNEVQTQLLNPNEERRMQASYGRPARALAPFRTAIGIALGASVAAVCLSERPCHAFTKDECLEAHSRGQDLRDKGQLTAARQLFLTCAQPSCPALVQADCAHLGEETDRLVPSVSFAARDSKGADLADTSVYVDGAAVAVRLDDGKLRDFDPGKHTVRFMHEGRETTLAVVLNQGEKGRTIVAVFGAPRFGLQPSAERGPAAPPATRSIVPLIVAGAGAAAAATGAVLVAVGLREVPDNCSLGAHECAAPAGDPALASAHRGVSLANYGLGVGIGGAALLLGGSLWYLLEPARSPREPVYAAMVEPWVGLGGGGIAASGRF